MRIGIYVDVANDDRPTGIGLHVVNLVNALAELDDANEYLLYYQCGFLGSSKLAGNWPSKENVRARPIRFPTRWKHRHPTLWWKHYLPRVLRSDRIDVFHGPNHFLPAFDRSRCIVTIHDLAYFRMEVHGTEHDAVYREWTRYALDRAAAVIALSENTRRDVAALGVEDDHIRVIYGGGHVVAEDQIRYDRVEELKRLRNLPEKYVLFVGTLQPRKNVPFLLRAFARLKKERGVPHKLVLAGHRDSAETEIASLIRELGIEADVIITGYVEAWELPLLYKLADLFVLPTLYEGFTLVTLEAMTYGVPVIATDTSSLREGMGDAGLLVQPNDVGELAKAMADAIANDELRQRMIERGKTQARKFTWERCARETLDLYREVGEAAVARSLPASLQETVKS